MKSEEAQKLIKQIVKQVDDETVFCSLCGRPFDREDYEKTMTEQTEGMRTDCGKWWNTGAPYARRYCGLFCSWLADPDFQADKYEQTYYGKRKYATIAKMRDYIAKRVAEYLLKEVKK